MQIKDSQVNKQEHSTRYNDPCRQVPENRVRVWCRAILTTMGILILLCLLLGPGASAAVTKTAYLGDMVTLSGSSPGSDIVYLFMTGPNLPPNGVALNNINRRADMGGFTTTDVDPNGHWEYKWYTNQIGGKIDTGTYTVWVTDRPVDRSHLSESDYHSIPVLLKPPGISPCHQPPPDRFWSGLYLIRRSFYWTEIIKGLHLPLSLIFPLETICIMLSSPGYQNLTTRVVVQESAITEVSIKLSAANGTLSVNTTPTGTEIYIDSHIRSLSPVVLSYPCTRKSYP